MGLKLGIDNPSQWLEDCPDELYDEWRAAYRLRPFGDEQEFLARILSVLILIAKRDMDIETVMSASNAIMQSLMTSEWVGAQESSQAKSSSVQSFEQTVSRMFG